MLLCGEIESNVLGSSKEQQRIVDLVGILDVLVVGAAPVEQVFKNVTRNVSLECVVSICCPAPMLQCAGAGAHEDLVRSLSPGCDHFG